MQVDEAILEDLRRAERARREGAHDAALQLVERARRRALQASGPRTTAYAFCAYVAGTVHEARRELLEAEDRYHEGLACFVETLGHDDPATATALQALASVRARLEPYPDAARAMEEALGALARTVGLFDPAYLEGLVALARYHYRGGDHIRSREALESALWVLRLAHADRRRLDPSHHTEAQRAAVLAIALGDGDQALQLLGEVGADHPGPPAA